MPIAAFNINKIKVCKIELVVEETIKLNMTCTPVGGVSARASSYSVTQADARGRR